MEAKMSGPVKFLGHPVHPMLVVYPLGLLSTGVIFDLISMGTDNEGFYVVSYWMIAAGLVGGLLAAIFGFMDWLSIRSGTRAKSVGGWHGVGNLVIVLLFATSWWLRSGVEDNVPGTLAFSLSLLGFGLALVTGWLGGELVYRLGMAVDEGAHENAPSSLSNEKAAVTPKKKQAGGSRG
jgi:uncharacterized membrane protein